MTHIQSTLSFDVPAEADAPAIRRCKDCHEPAVEGRKRCEKHLAKARAHTLRHSEENRTAGFCASGSCKRPPAPGKKTCAYHLAYQKRYQESHKGIPKPPGICSQAGCARPAKPGLKTCQKCIDRVMRAIARKPKWQPKPGGCTRKNCPRPADPGYKTCQYHREYSKRYFASRSEEFSERNRVKVEQIRREVVAAYGGACCVCGETDPIVLQLDHINGYGSTPHKPRGGHSLYRALRREGYPREGYQLLCAVCHVRKTYLDCGFGPRSS